MTESLGLETRDVTVGSALQRHQLKSYLEKAGIEFVNEPNYPTFTITANPDQWVKVDEWIERIKEGR